MQAIDMVRKLDAGDLTRPHSIEFSGNALCPSQLP
jgi:hypothetical protein